MNQHISESQLNDYVDDVLDDTAREQVRAHLAECADCRNEVAAMSALLNDIDALPSEITPSRDLRSGIAERLATGDRPLRRRGSGWYRTAALIAAAASIVVITATVTHWWTVRDVRPVARAVAPRTTAVVPVAFRKEEARYRAEISDLQQVLDRERGQLAPQTVQILERNMKIIDQAITESRAALNHDPANRDLGQMVLSAYQQKLDLLRRARAFAL